MGQLRRHRHDTSLSCLGDVLCVDDDEVVQILLEEVVSLAGARYHDARSARQARRLLSERCFDLIVLDRRLPDSDGLLLIETIQQRNECPVIVLSRMADPQDRQLGLGLGATEYLTKPCNPAELSTRIRHLIERSHRARRRSQDKPITLGRLTLNPLERRLRIDDAEQYLPPAEARMLHLLLQYRGQVLDRDDLTQAACGRIWSPGDRTADVLIARLRKRIPSRVATITTVHRFGYVLHDSSEN